MRIVTIGGGPAGLYASLLIKKAHPSHRITLIERNPPGATYGWGVVFSDRTLAEFREADARSYDEITSEFVLWDAIDVRFKGQVVRSGGHVFAGLARTRLLGILQRRCQELGVDLRFETEATGLEGLDADLVIGADGVHSAVRAARGESYKTRFEEGRARYIWFGSPLVLDSFTFSFRTSDHGLFQAHAYPFDGETSTFIVECDEATWRRAGLDRAGEAESIAFCEGLFRDDLRGRPLLSNNSRWISFVTVRNRTWRDRNVVLLGDAAHTAHFSIGSGTKLAMEDAIALARAVERHGDDVAAALADYEAERKPVVERFQHAADESRTYFERTSRYLHLESEQFAFNLLSRSGRIDYDVLRIRDPGYVDGVDRWYAGVPAGVAPPPLFTPVRLAALELPSRVVRSPAPSDACDDGVPTGEDAAALVDAARDASLVLAGPVAVSPEARITPGDPGMYAPAHGGDWRGIADALHERGARLGLRLGHAGRRGAARPRHAGVDRPLEIGGWKLLAASPLQHTPASAVPREMSSDDRATVIRQFGESARRAAEAGVDLLTVHMAHGYLLGGFLSPLANVRTDEYGGALRDRIRFPLEVFAAVRSVWPGPLAVTLGVADWERGGLEVEDGAWIAAILAEAGCDAVEVLAGQTTPRARPRYGPAFLASLADVVRNEARIPVIVGGAIATTGRANTILAAGRADLCILDAGWRPAYAVNVR